MGHVGNNGTLDTDYGTSIANRTIAATPGQGAFRFGSVGGSAQADFDLSGEAITSYGQGVAAGSYVVRQGDTLETIAAQLWGDASLWYKLAEANGMSASNGLAEGQRLTVPAGVARNRHNASTFKPYDPTETLGDLTPATPQPKAAKRGKCGIFGQLLLIAVAVAVSVVTAGALSGMSPILIGAISGAAGSIASQTVGLVTGIQEKFSFKGVALAALGGAVGGAIGPKGLFGPKGAFGGVKSGFLQGALRGAAGSALTQGIGVAVGLQKKFDFAGVAAAGVGGGITASLAKTPLAKDNSLANHLTHAGAAGASAIGNAAVRSLIDGTNFGDNLIAALPDVIGSTIGNMIGFGVSGAAGSAAAKAVEVAEEFITKLPAPLVDAIRARGGELVVQPDGTISVKGYRRGSVSAQMSSATASAEAVTWGSDLGGAWFGGYGAHVFIDTHDPTTWTFGADDGEGVNLDFATSADLIRSDWVESGGTAVRILTGMNGASFIYAGGTQSYAGLGVRVSYGADVPPPGYYQQVVSGAFGAPANSLGISLTPSFRPLPISLTPVPGKDRSYSPIHFPGSEVSSIRHLPPGMRNTQETMAHLGRLNKGFGSLLYGTAEIMGASPDTQEAAWGAGSALDGFAIVPRAPGLSPRTPFPYANPRSRPPYGPGQVDRVWETAQRNGVVVDPNTGNVLNWDRSISRAGQWDMGHRPGFEYRDLHARYRSGEISYDQFLREYRDPNNYRPEGVGPNRSRRYERGR